MLPLVKREEVTPMEVTSNIQSPGVFKVMCYWAFNKKMLIFRWGKWDKQKILCWQQSDLCPQQQSLDMTTGHLNKNRSFSSSLPQIARDPDKGQTPVFTNTEPLSTIQKQDIAPTSSFSVPADSLIQQGSQQFLLETRNGLVQDRPGSGPTAVGRLCGEPTTQAQLPLFPPDEVAQLEEAVKQLKAKGFCSLPLQPDNSLAKQQQHIQHQQQLQKQQIQQQQQLQVLENFQQQLFQPQIQMQCDIFQDTTQAKSKQQGSPGVASNQASLFQQTSQQQQQQQQVSLFQTSNLLSIQTNFLQRTPSHPSPPMFHNSSSLAETPDPQGALFQKASQEQVQATLFQSTMSVLQSPEQQPSTTGLFLSQTSLPSQLTTNNTQQQQQQQMVFLDALQTPNPEQSVFQAQTQLSPIQQRGPMEQQPPTQLQSHTHSGQQASLFQNIPTHPSANTLSSNQQQQQQQAGILFCNSRMSNQDQANLLFSSQNQMSQMAVNQQDRSEPMALGNPTDPRQQVLFQNQQPMQLGNSSGNQQESPVTLFMPQSNIASLQEGLAAQELAQSSLFTTQNSVANLQTTTSSPVQHPVALYQTAVTGNISQPNQNQQPGLFLFGIQNGKKKKNTVLYIINKYCHYKLMPILVLSIGTL